MPADTALLSITPECLPPPSARRQNPDEGRYPAGQALGHPAGQALDRRGTRPTGSISFGALRAITSGLARVQEPVPLGEDSTNPRSVLLLATAFYEAWLITWPDGSGLASHDHGEARSTMHVIDGELIEIYSDYSRRAISRVRVLERGDSTCADPSLVHDLANRSGADATTIHVYSPALTGFTFIEQRWANEPERMRSAAVAEQNHRARSDDLPPLRLPLLTRVEDEARLPSGASVGRQESKGSLVTPYR